jgi:hypothetical protein
VNSEASESNVYNTKNLPDTIMSKRSVSLPALTDDRPLRLTPTDVSQFVRLEQCERYLRFRLAERAGQRFMEEYDVIPQRITPLLSLSGSTFETGVEENLSQRFASVHFASRYSLDHNRPQNNAEVAREAQTLAPGQAVLLFQPRLEAEVSGWRLRGDVDLIRLERDANGVLHVLISDLKSTTVAKVEHRLQVAFYRIILERIFEEHGIAHQPIAMGILFRPPTDPNPDEEEELEPLRETAREVFGLDQMLLEIVANPEAYIQSAYDLVLAQDSLARQVAQAPFETVPYCLSFKCDGCLYNEFCMKWSAEREDLSLLSYVTGTEKEALRKAGITTISQLATLKDFLPADGGKPPSELVPAAGRESQVKQIAASWPVGPRLDELIHRAKNFWRFLRKDGTQALSYIPGKGNSSLPVSRSDLNPNLVRIYLDAQYDYLEGRVYLLGALVVASKDGMPVARRSVVHLTVGPPQDAAAERTLFQEWTKGLVEAVGELAQCDVQPGEKKSAPIHVIFFDRYEQRLMLEALARNFPPILEATPPLYDFLTQIAAFDSPIASFLDEELRTFRNLPMTCQSLQSVAAYLKFDWNAPHKFRELFKARMFDYLGKLDMDGVSEWFTRRSRFASSVPLEYAYAAWGELPMPASGKHDEFEDFRGATRELLIAF